MRSRTAHDVTGRVAATGLAVTALLLLSGCGGGDGGETKGAAGASTGAPVTTPAVPGASAQNPAAAGAEAGLGPEICRNIAAVQKDLGSDAQSVGYLTQYTLKMGAWIIEENAIELYRERSDEAARRTCPGPYAAFLKQAAIESLRAGI